MQALVVLGILIGAVGLLLLIGYNWSLLAPAAKVGVILAAVALAFAGSAFAYRARRSVIGEALAFAGTLIYCNAIWLIAQVLHVQGHFPDGFLWSALGALAVAWLLRSTWNGAAAAALLAAWSVAEGIGTPGNNFLFLPLWAAAVYLARSIGSRVTLGLAALALVVWIGALDHMRTPGPMLMASIVLAAGAVYAIGSWERERLRLAWQVVGLVTLLVSLVPLMIVGAQSSMLHGDVRPPVTVLVVSAVLILVAVLGGLRARSPVDWGVAATGLAAVAWVVAAAAGADSPVLGAVIFSGACLGLGITLIRTALDAGRIDLLAWGVLFAVAFMLVRWLSVIESMLWSGAFLLAAGGGLLVLARLWRSRDGTEAPGGAA
jgi:uncharacterized membrane protein